MQKVITTYDELLDWSKRANFNTNLKERVMLQDEFGRSNARVIEKLWEQSIDCSKRNLVCFALHKIMGDDYLTRYIDVWVRVKIDHEKARIEEYLRAKSQELNRRFEDLAVAKKTVAKRVRYAQRITRDRDNKITFLRKEIRDLLDDNKKLHNSLSGAFNQAAKYEHYATRYFDMLGFLNIIKQDMIEKSMGVLK